MRKRKMLLLLLCAVLLGGCLQSVEDEIFSQLVARRAGYNFAKANPSMVPAVRATAVPILEALNNGATPETGRILIKEGIAQILRNNEDRLLAADAYLILEALKFEKLTDGPIDSRVKISYMINIVHSFLDGVAFAVQEG